MSSETMQAWVFKKKGAPSDVLRKVEDWPKPVPRGKQVLIKIHAASLNPIGWKGMGVFPISALQKVPSVPEADLAGTIAGGNLEGSGFALGDAVFGQIPYGDIFKTGGGVLAEYAVIDHDLLVKKPDNISFEEAASFPLAGLTAWYVLGHLGGLKKDQDGEQKRVFINGGSGGVGGYAVQIARLLGAFVVTTCSDASWSYVESLKPNEVINYRQVDLAQELTKRYSSRPFDLIFDTVGIDLHKDSPKFLKADGPGYIDIAGPHMTGTVMSTIGSLSSILYRTAWPRLLGGTPRKYRFARLPVEKMVPELKQAAELFKDGEYEAKGGIPMVDSVHSFDEALKAYERQMSLRAKGKVVVKVVA
ncbi:BZ3500_MvSof-1268-A1-R1_Chr3-1g05482 [Microbotryum saponariae]|uniref:BZ3500_MvSof-1268-A1-R1_Chr3-1g05482 protein n=1 Tax=Microbotryum saponariae TaxID=289078 RepID=A0A2X0KZP4_9BASI|nr:BZ3500_MvSof-1268-A1-R1_Chr3-1g05482 [Microbotryum saponariae]SDA04673.1 BZ3501_MvSof-1269-A2-R1_Chr3-1g05153 [Microbotryum saponariae]